MSIATTIPLIILIGFIASVLASMMGLGGGLVAIPLILLVVGGEHTMVAKLISYVSIIGLSIFGAYKYWKQKRKPKFKISFFILLGVIPATTISSIYLGPLLEDYATYFHFLYAIVVIGVVVLINIKDKLPKTILPNWSLPLLGLGIGTLSGSVGLSGGVLFIPLLAVGLSLPLKEAAVTSLVLKMGAATTNVITNVANGNYNFYLGNSNIPGIVWYLPLIILIGSFLGSQLGPRLNKKITDKQMIMIFNLIMAIMLVWEITEGSLMLVGIKI